MPLNSQVGIKAETTWGTPVVVDRFFEFESESIAPEAGRYESPVLRAGTRGLREDRFVPFTTGHAGSLTLPVMTKGFGLWLEHILGNTGTGSAVDSAYTYTGTVATLCGKGFTLQVNRPLGACGDTAQAFTYEGGKVQSAKFSMEQGGALMCELDMLFENGVTATALATASYPTGAELFSWADTALTIGGTATPVSSWSVTINNQLQADRLKIRGNVQRQEPVESAHREITFECTADFDNLTQYSRVISATAAGSVAAVVVTCGSPTLIGTTSTPQVLFTMSAVRFDGASNAVDGPGIISQSLSGKALVPNSGSFLSIAYRTADATA